MGRGVNGRVKDVISMKCLEPHLDTIRLQRVNSAFLGPFKRSSAPNWIALIASFIYVSAMIGIAVDEGCDY